MRFRHIFAISLVLLLPMLLIGGIAAFASSNSADPQGNNTPHSQSSGPAPSRGAPAITPRIKGVPAFTAGDVGVYYQNHSFSAGPTVSGAPPTIVSVRFITSQEAQVLMGGESVGLPGNALVCYVELRGPFYPKLVSVPPGQALPTTVDTGIEVFDAQTGNILLWSVA